MGKRQTRRQLSPYTGKRKRSKVDDGAEESEVGPVASGADPFLQTSATTAMATSARISAAVAKEIAEGRLSLFVAPAAKSSSIEAFIALRRMIVKECTGITVIIPSGAAYYCAMFGNPEQRDAAFDRLTAIRDKEATPTLRVEVFGKNPARAQTILF
jgi:hypothetical protein